MLSNDLSVKLYQSISGADEPRVFKHWHCSSISDCPRSHYFKRLGIGRLEFNRPSAARLLRWSAGHHLEQAIRPHVANVWGGTESNRRLTSQIMDLTGEFDNLFIEGNRLIEIKSVHDFAFIERDGRITLKRATGRKNKWGKDEYEPLLKPYLHHELQNHAYALLLGEEETKVEGIDYVYLSLSGRIAVYTTSVQQKLLDNVLTRLEVLNNAWRAKEPPQCTCKPDSQFWGPVYQYCDYRTETDCCSLDLIKKERVAVSQAIAQAG